ncbi:hypothetical protein F4821DRAFT_277032 [Hypoxylon rubiginosum]|uniref:Uncharacterized protein n=1 Tax=Hypoxylon rubiginosum TaxID=110542 RepID=A0ACC0CIF6_9PEZI|nr:hypothetical protein F4821DRAFT_277032 [Hypoxylon rubiginosum]
MAERTYDGLSLEQIVGFKKAYSDKIYAIEANVRQVIKILESGINSGAFRAIPITMRMKESGSALNSLHKRQKIRYEREDLRTRMANKERNWDEYWTERTALEQTHNWASDIEGMKTRRSEDQIHNYGRFVDSDNMVDALQDLGGVRVCVYFPHDVDKVLSFLDQREDVKILWVTRKTQRTTDMDDLRNHVNILEGRSPTANPHHGTFAGYRATHTVVELMGGAIPKGQEESHYKVEVQIGTVVMHAWSEVEHDIIYKPGQAEPSDEEKGILDLFNGLVLSGEAALNQLAAYTIRKERDRARDNDAEATSHHELGAWLASYYEKKPVRRRVPLTWNILEQLFGILRSSGHHTPGRLNKLLDKVYKSSESDFRAFNEDLPFHLLRAYIETATSTASTFSAETEKNPIQKTRLLARYLAFRVVHSINMASYLGILDGFLRRVRITSPCPSMIDFLELLHPQPRLNNRLETTIIEFCNEFLNLDNQRHRKDTTRHLELPLLLTDIGCIVYPIGNPGFSDGECLTVVPRVLSRFLSDPENTYWIPDILERMEDVIAWPTEYWHPNGADSIVFPIPDSQSDLKCRVQGFFEPVEPGIHTWRCFMEQRRPWCVKTVDLTRAILGPKVENLNRTCQWVDFVKCLNPKWQGVLQHSNGPQRSYEVIDQGHTVFAEDLGNTTYKLKITRPAVGTFTQQPWS